MGLYSFLFLFISFNLQAKISPQLLRQSVRSNHPLILNAKDEVYAAKEKINYSRGYYDSKIIGDHYRVSTGMWARTLSDVMIEKPVEYNNSKIYTGYSYGFNGLFPPQFSTLSTNSGGTPRVGFSTSLWRNREIDGQRGNIKTSDIEHKIAQESLKLSVWELEMLAEIYYWDWVTSIKVQKVFENLLKNAQERENFLKSRVETGAIPKITLRENEQYIASRKALFFGATERRIKSSYQLSLFYRNSDGERIIPTDDHGFEEYPSDLNEFISKIESSPNATEITKLRPEILTYELELNKTRIDLALSEQWLKPKLDLWGDYSRNIGDEDPSNPPHVLSFGFKLEIPLERNIGLSSISMSKNALRIAERRLDYEKQKISSQLSSAYESLVFQKQQVEQAQIELDRASEILVAENFKFKTGGGNLFLVNLREENLARAEASLYEVTLNFMTNYLNYQAKAKLTDSTIGLE